MKLAVIFPSRGLAFSQTCEELLENLTGYDYDIFFSHKLPLPDCYNKALEQALRGSYTHFWLVADDVVLPKNTLKRLLAAKEQAIACDYPISYAGKPSIFRDPEGDAIYGGTGCLLVTRKFLEAYKQPFFRTDILWDVKLGDRFEATPRKIKGNQFGTHEITFGLLAYNRGTPIKVSKIQCGQRKLKALGQAGTNNGEHLIQTWVDLIPESMPEVDSTNQSVELKDGTRTMMSSKRADQLEKEDKVKIIKLIELVDNNVLKELT